MSLYETSRTDNLQIVEEYSHSGCMKKVKQLEDMFNSERRKNAELQALCKAQLSIIAELKHAAGELYTGKLPLDTFMQIVNPEKKE